MTSKVARIAPPAKSHLTSTSLSRPVKAMLIGRRPSPGPNTTVVASGRRTTACGHVAVDAAGAAAGPGDEDANGFSDATVPQPGGLAASAAAPSAPARRLR